MNYINSTPAADGFRMPAEFERHQGCIMIWPERPGSWAYGAKAAKKAFAQIASVISESEQVYMIVSEGRKEEAAKMLPESVRLVVMDTDDAWARDTGPTFVVSGNEDTPYEARDLRGINWEFNAWGGIYDGLYADWDNDNLVAGQFMSYLGCQGYNAAPFVLEGGSIHTDGEGTMLVTESCLLSKGRNPQLSREQIENFLFQLTSDLIMGVVKEQEQAANTTIPDKDKRFIADFYKYSFVGIMLDWIKQGMKGDYEEIARMIAITLHGGIANSIRNFTKAEE